LIAAADLTSLSEVSHFAMANPKHFGAFEFAKVWNPIPN
jgi:hypothetical protein